MKIISKNLKSSNIERVLKVEEKLIVVFKGGGAYEYTSKYPEHVKSENDFKSICEAESAGKYIHSNIKGNYTYVKMSKEDFEVLLSNGKVEVVE